MLDRWWAARARSGLSGPVLSMTYSSSDRAFAAFADEEIVFA